MSSVISEHFQIDQNRLILLFRIGIFLSGFYIGGFAVSYSFGLESFFGVKLNDFIVIIFTCGLVYFSWIQNKFVHLQYDLTIEQSQPAINIDFETSNKQYFKIINVGKTTATDIELIVFDNASGNEYPNPDVEELLPGCSKVVFYDPGIKIKKGTLLSIVVNYKSVHADGSFISAQEIIF